MQLEPAVLLQLADALCFDILIQTCECVYIFVFTYLRTISIGRSHESFNSMRSTSDHCARLSSKRQFYLWIYNGPFVDDYKFNSSSRRIGFGTHLFVCDIILLYNYNTTRYALKSIGLDPVIKFNGVMYSVHIVYMFYF